jgi:hypothetical protein
MSGFPSGTIVLRTTGCRACGGIVYVCTGCAAGQLYCSLFCRQSARRKQTREANRRYLATDAGRQRNRERQQRFRERRNSLNAVQVADMSSRPELHQAQETGHVTERSMPRSAQLTPHELMAPSSRDDQDSARQPRLPSCIACGRSSNVFDLNAIPSAVSERRRWRRMLRRFRHTDASTTKSVQKTAV